MILYSAETFSSAFEGSLLALYKPKRSKEFVTEILNLPVSRTCIFMYFIITHMMQYFVCSMRVASSAKQDVRSRPYFSICTITKVVVDIYGDVSVQVKRSL